MMVTWEVCKSVTDSIRTYLDMHVMNIESCNGSK